MTKEREAVWHYLCSLQNIGYITIGRLLEYTGELMEILELEADELKEAGFMDKKMLAEWNNTKNLRQDYLKKYDELEGKSYRFISMEHDEYPEKLKNIPEAPYGLWVKGKLPANDYPMAAIIGSRVCTDYGFDLAKKIGQKLAAQKVGVVSGMAAGIDASGQMGALDKKGYSLAVLGCGIDICYPMQNIELYERLTVEGGIISEYAPGCPGFAQNFRQRNRLISGMSDCVIVAEAKKKSGTQLTVSWALDQGKDIFVVPGRLTDVYSKGCNEMIYQGATILYDLALLGEYFGIGEIKMTEEADRSVKLNPEENLVYEKMTHQLQHFESILFKTNLTPGMLWQAIYRLETMNLISQPVKNYFKKTL